MITGIVIGLIVGSIFGALVLGALAALALANTEATSYLRGHRDGRAGR
jgi:hypothetical protein